MLTKIVNDALIFKGSVKILTGICFFLIQIIRNLKEKLILNKIDI